MVQMMDMDGLTQVEQDDLELDLMLMGNMEFQVDNLFFMLDENWIFVISHIMEMETLFLTFQANNLQQLEQQFNFHQNHQQELVIGF